MVNTKLEHEQIFIPPDTNVQHHKTQRLVQDLSRDTQGVVRPRWQFFFSEAEEFTLRCPQGIGAEPNPQPCLGDELQALLPVSTSNGMERFQALNGEGFGFHLMMPTFWVF